MNNNELTIEQQLDAELELEELSIDGVDVDELADAELSTSLVPYEGDPGDETDFDPEAELVAGEAVSLEQVLDTIFSILATQAAQIQALGEYVFAPQQPAEPEVPKLTVVTDLS